MGEEPMDFKIKATRKASPMKGSFKGFSAWTCIITNPRGQKIQREFFMGQAYTEAPTVEQVLMSLISDAEAYDSVRDAGEFMADFGYEEYAHALSAYRACGKTADRMITFLTSEEREHYRDQ